MLGYAMSQEGYLARWNQRTGQRKTLDTNLVELFSN